MEQYKTLLRDILERGELRADRTGTGTKSLFGTQMRFDLTKGFPLVTTKYTNLRLITEELLWFLRGGSNARELQDANVHIWDEWATESGALGPIYGTQWRTWGMGFLAGLNPHYDQIQSVIDSLKARPFSRRHIVSAWNVNDLPDETISPQQNVRAGRMALAPCHVLFQFYVREHDGNRYLSCQMYQRSVDSFLGLPFNIASYALLTHMIAQQVDMIADELVWVGGDTHLYSNHFERTGDLLTRTPYPLPTLHLNKAPDINSYTAEDVRIEGYQSHPAIKAPISI